MWTAEYVSSTMESYKALISGRMLKAAIDGYSLHNKVPDEHHAEIVCLPLTFAM